MGRQTQRGSFPIALSAIFLRTVVGLAVALLLLLSAGTALAAGPTLHMTGQAVVDQRGEQPRLRFSVDAADGSGWRLDTTLVPTTARRGRESEEEDEEDDEDEGWRGNVVALNGTYQLSGPGVSVVSGQATGRLDRRGVGQLQLVGTSDNTALTAGSAPLRATFSIADSGQIDLNLTGPLPSPPATTTTAKTADATEPVDHTFWYISRAAGFTAYALLTLSVCLGLLVRTRLLDALVARWRSFDLHQFTALLALGFVALHVFSLLGDHYIGFQLDQLLVPLASPYRPAQVALGIIALYLLVVVVGSFYVRRAIGYGTWRAIHYATFGLFVLVLAHGILAGTDSGESWARAIYWGTGLLVAALTLWRARRGSDQRRPGQPAGASVAVRAGRT